MMSFCGWSSLTRFKFSQRIIFWEVLEWIRIRSFDELLVLVLTCTCLYVVCCTICFERLYGFEYVVNMLYTFRVSICVWYKHLYIYWNVIKFINNNIKKIDSNLWWHHLRLSKKQGYYTLHLSCHLSDPWKGGRVQTGCNTWHTEYSRAPKVSNERCSYIRVQRTEPNCDAGLARYGLCIHVAHIHGAHLSTASSCASPWSYLELPLADDPMSL